MRRRFPLAAALATAALFAAGPSRSADAQDKPADPAAPAVKDEGAAPAPATAPPATPPTSAPPAAAPPAAPPKAPEKPADGARRAPDPTQVDLTSYRLRVDDQVEISVYNPGSLTHELARTVVVPGNGEVSFPPLGRVNLLGKTPFEVEATIAARLKDDGYLQAPIVGCFVTQFAPRQVYLIGAARGTVDLPVHRELRILELLSRAGSLSTPDADFSRVRVRRIGNDGRPFPIDVSVNEILERNDDMKNIVVREGDVIDVPRLETASPISSDWVYVLGTVANPGRHPLITGRTPFTLTKLIAIVGDFTEFANRSKIKVIRTTATGRQFLEVDFDELLEGDRPDLEMRPDDVVYVPESFL